MALMQLLSLAQLISCEFVVIREVIDLNAELEFDIFI